MIEHESLEVLVAIANHPGLAPSLEEVIIDSFIFNLGNEHELGGRLLKNRFKKGLHTRDVLLHTGQARSMLVEAFSKLPNLRVLGLRDYNSRGRRRDSDGAYWRSAGWSLGDSTYLSTAQQLFPLILTALSAANARPTSIEVFIRNQEMLHPGSFASTDSFGTLPILNSLKTLMLSLSSRGLLNPSLTAEDAVIHEAPLRQFLTKLIAIVHLRLNFVRYENMAQSLLNWLIGLHDCSSIGKHIDWMVSAPAFNTLRVLDIGMARVKPDTLVKVLGRFDLQSFSLWKVVLIGDAIATLDLWSRFLTRVAGELRQPDQIRDVMIGYAAQDHDVGSIGSLQYIPVSWICESDLEHHNGQVKRDTIVKYRAQCTGTTVQDWLQSLSKLVHVQHPEETSRRESSEIDSNFSEEEFHFNMDHDGFGNQDGDEEEESEEDLEL